ncbi:MAG: methyltransferase domain-containing protein [Janthinobacterium lividum]
MRRTLSFALVLISFTFVIFPHAQNTAQNVPQNTATAPAAHPTSTPYTGDLGIFEDPNRDKLLQTDRVLDTLHLRAGSTVADIGAGGGWFSVRAARRVGPTGRVYAEDINPRAVDSIRERADREHLPEIVPVLGTPDDPKLTPDSLDAAVMLRVYHEVAHPPLLLEDLHRALRQGGRFGVIDHPGNGADHGINADVVRTEVEHHGFRFVGLYDFTKGDQNDYMELFEKR